MTKASNRLASLLHRLGAGRRVRLDAANGSGGLSVSGTGASETGQKTGAAQATGVGPGRWASAARLGAVTLSVCGLMGVTAASALAAGPPEIGSGGEFTSSTAKPAAEVRLEAAVNPNNEATKCEFEYGETVASEHNTACTEPAGGIAEGGEQRAAVTVTGLKAGTTYHWRVVLKNASGKIEGTEEEITTVPAPSTEVPSVVGATTATFKGKLEPLNKTVGTQYFFFYNREEETMCLNERATGLEPETSLTGSGVANVSTQVTELEANQKYTVCLADTNVFGGVEEDLKPSPVHFTTKPAPPKIDGESAAVNSTEATLFAAVNPNNESTKYVFEYSTTESNKKLTGTIVTLTGGSELTGGSDQTAEVPTGAVLEAGKTYYYRVVAENAQSETEPHPAEGEVQSFTTAPTPNTDPVTAIGTTTATFNGHLTLNATATSYSFDYKLGTGTECAGESSHLPHRSDQLVGVHTRERPAARPALQRLPRHLQHLRLPGWPTGELPGAPRNLRDRSRRHQRDPARGARPRRHADDL